MEKLRNRLFACGTAAFMLLSALPLQTAQTAFAAEIEAASRGDVNGDGKRDNDDLAALTKLLGEHVETILTEDGLEPYDITQDGVIDVRDRYALSQYLSGAAAELPVQPTKDIEDTVTLRMSNASCFPGDDVQVTLSFVDWAKDIAAYDINILYDTALKLKNVEFLSGDSQYKSNGKSLKLSGLHEMDSLHRGDFAVMTFTTSKDYDGDINIQVQSANIFTSDYSIYEAIKPASVVTVQPLYEPVSLTASGVGSKSVSLKWDMPFTDQPIDHFCVYRDCQKVAETKDTFYVDTKLTTDTDYEYTVSAITVSGTETAQSLALNVHTAAAEIVSAEFPADPVSDATSDLTVKLSHTTPVASMKLDFKDAEGAVVSDTVSLDGEDLDSISYHWDVSKVADGDYTITVTVTDIDGASAQTDVTVSVLNNPLQQLTLEAAAGGRTAVLTWSLAQEASVTGYRVYRLNTDGKTWEPIADVSGRNTLSYTDSNLTVGTKYTYAVTSIDSFGRESAKSKSASVSPTADKTAPEITLFKPAGGQRVSGEIQIKITAKDENEVASVRCEISADEGKTWEKLCETEGASGTWLINTADHADGVYQLRAMATDADKNDSSTINVISLAFDNTAPEQVKNLRTVDVTQNTASIAWDNVADEDFDHFVVIYSAQGTPTERTVKDTLGINLSGLTPDTQYTVSVYAVDVAGNAGPASAPFRFYSNSDTTPPTITYVGIPSDCFSSNSSLNVTVSASDLSGINSKYLQYSQDKEKWTTLTVANNRNFVISGYGLKEGPLYFRAYASDPYGNVGDPEKAQIYTVTIDNTAPTAPGKIIVETELRSNVVSWAASESEDVAYYRVERAVGEDSVDFTSISARHGSTSLTDSNVVADGVYYYRVFAVDRAGNMSIASKSGRVKRIPDTENPVIVECGLTSGQPILCTAHRSFQIMATDDNRVKTITAAYRFKDTDNWTTLTTKEQKVNTLRTELIVSGEFPETVLKAETVTLQATAVDEAGNTDVAEFTFKVDDRKAEIKDAAVKSENKQVIVSWTCPDITGVSAFYLFRKIGTAGEEICVARTNPVKDQTAYTAADPNLTTGGTFIYRIMAQMSNGNTVSVTLDPIKVQAVPQAVLEYTPSQECGASYSYDARGSVNAADINNVRITFGDGAFAEKKNVENALFTHAYAEVGTYEVTLTVTNSSGLTDTKTVSVTVMEPNIMSTVVASVTKMDGTPAAGAAVYVDVGTDQQTKYTTDGNGRVEFCCTAGEHEFGVFGNGYLPATKSATLHPGAKTEINFSIVEDQLVKANFEVNRMTLAEIKAAGIDVKDPENCQMVKIDVQLSYTVTSTVTDHIKIYYDRVSGIAVYGGGGNREYNYVVKSVSRDVKTVILMRIPVKAQFVKEFFKVDMIVMNNAGEGFPLTDCTATLNLPSGLTLMENTPASEPRVVNIGTIPGGQQHVISWIVRGDKKGEYYFNADFNGTLQPFNESVSMNFPSDKPITVYGQEAATITVNFDPVIRGKNMYAEVLVENNSPIDLYELSTDIGKVIADTVGTDKDGKPMVSVYQTRFTGKNGILKIIDDSKSISVLHPGEKFSVVYLIRGVLAQNLPGVYKKTEAEVRVSSTSQNVKVQVQHVQIANENDPLYGIAFDKDTDFLFMVKNKKGKTVSNASVELYEVVNGGRSVIARGTTDSRGRLVVSRGEPDDSRVFRVEITADGYRRLNERFEFPARKSTYMETFVLNGDYRADDYSLTSAAISSTKTGWIPLLTRTYSVDRADDFTFTIFANAENEGTKYELRQDNRTIKSVTGDGTNMAFTELTPRDFYKDEPVYIRIYTEKGDYFDNTIGLKIIEIPKDPSDDPRAKAVFGDVAAAISDNTEVGVPMPDAIRETNGDHFDLTINIPNLNDFKKYNPDTGTYDYEKGNGKLNSFTCNMKVEGDVMTLSMGFQVERKIHVGPKDFLAVNFKMAFSITGKFDMETNLLTVDVTATLSLSGSWTSPEWHPKAPPVLAACFLRISVTASGSLTFTHSYTHNFTTGANDYKPSIGWTASLGVNPRGGIGSEKVIALELYGDATLSAKGNVVPDPCVSEATVIGTFGGRAIFLNYTFADYKFISTPLITIWPRSSARPRLVMPDGETLEDLATNPDSYAAPSEVSIPTAGEFNGTVGEGLTEMQSGIAFGSSPLLASDGTNVIMVWTVQDASRGSMNAAYLVYSVYDPNTGRWSAPQEVDSNKNADNTPVLFAGTDGIRIAYLESGKVFEEEETSTLEDYAKQLVFRTAKFDAETGKFTNFRKLDVNAEGGFASSPAFAQAADGTTYLFWQSNENGNVFGTDASNKILCAKETADGWDTPTVLAEELPQLYGFAAGTNADGEPVYAYVTGEQDEEGFTVNTLYTAGLTGEATALATGAITAPKFAQIPGKDVSGLIWSQDGKLCASTDLTDAEDLCSAEYGVSERYAIAGDRVLFVENTQNKAEVFSMTYDAEAKAFTAPVSIEAGENLYYESISLAQSGNDTLYALRRTEATFDEDSNLTTSSALVGGILGETADIRISEPVFSHAAVEAGKALPITVTAYNDGTEAVDTLTLRILNNAGKEIATDTKEVALTSGASAEVAFAPVLPASLEPSVCKIYVTAGGNEKTPDNNQAELNLAKTDLSVETDITYVGDTTRVAIFARNESNVPTAAVVHIQPASEEEETLTLFSEEIAPHSAAYWELDSADMLGKKYRDFVNIRVESEAEDVDDSNNTDCVVISRSGMDPYAAGDVNLDGEVGLEDAVLTLKCYTRQVALLDDLGFSSTQRRCADVDKDGSVSVEDAMILLKYYVNCVAGNVTGSFTEYLAQVQNGGAKHESE